MKQLPKAFFAASKERKTYVHLAGDWPFDCWDGVKAALCIGIIMPDGKADKVGYASTPLRIDRALQKAGYKMCA